MKFQNVRLFLSMALAGEAVGVLQTTDHIFGIAEQFCPGFRTLVVDTAVFTPLRIEQEIGIRYGHIHHVDNTFGFDQRMPYATGVAGLYSCSAGCHPAGSVLGAAGHNCAVRVMNDLGVRG